MSRNERYVMSHPDGWAVTAANSRRASSIHRTREEAIVAAKRITMLNGGGEVRVQGRDGSWRKSDTVPRGNDPFPPRG